jgi:hypothetical protein
MAASRGSVLRKKSEPALSIPAGARRHGAGDAGRSRRLLALQPGPGRIHLEEGNKTMKYMCLIYDNEKRLADMSPEQMQALGAEYFAFTDEVKKAGVFVAGDALQPTSSATTVRVRSGKPLHTDGPFAETKEQLGGYYILDCKDLDEALRWAAKIPDARNGSVEVRPIQIFE